MDYEALLDNPKESGLQGEELIAALKRAMRAEPQSALVSADEYIDLLPENERAPLLRAAMRAAPDSAMIGAPNYIHHLPKDEIAPALEEVMRLDPQTALKYPDRYGEYLPKEKLDALLEELGKTMVNNLDGIEGYGRGWEENVPQDVANSLHTVSAKTKEALEIGEQLNDRHEMPSEQRFSIIKDYDSKQLYELISYGRSEMFTSTFVGTFDRLHEKLTAEHKNIYDVVDPQFPQSTAVFLEAATAYGKLDQAMPLVPKEKWGEVLDQFGTKISEGNASYAVALADMVKGAKDPAIKQQLKEFVEEKYQNAPEGKEKDTYGVLISYHNTQPGVEQIPADVPDKYQAPPIKELSREAIVGKDGMHRQLVVFPGDEDGRNSYANYITRYQKNEHYKFEDKGDYIKITPTSSADIKMEIYANKPGHDPAKIVNNLKEQDGKPPEFDSVINRGHSYNIDETMPYFSSNMSLAFLGSCGGYSNVEKLLRIAPDAQVISTKETGAMAVNDPLIYHINESIRTGQPVNWEHEQKYLDSLGSPRKQHYVLPHRNTALAMQAKINELENERSSSVAKEENKSMEQQPHASAADPSNQNHSMNDALAAAKAAGCTADYPCAPSDSDHKVPQQSNNAQTPQKSAAIS